MRKELIAMASLSFALLLSAGVFAQAPEAKQAQGNSSAHDANWWYEKYQKLGDTDPKWDALVREGIDHWLKARAAANDRAAKPELVLSVGALEKAYAAGCRNPVALFIDARNLPLAGSNEGSNVQRFRLALALTAGKPELDFLRSYCANLQGWNYKMRGAYPKAIESFELALSIRAPEIDEQLRKDAEVGLQQAKEEFATKQEVSARLTALTLSPHPSKEQVCSYVRQVFLQAIRRPAPSWNDPEIAMLEKVGPENLDVLPEMWDANATSGIPLLIINNDVGAAVKALVRPEHKSLLLKWLPLRESLAEPMQRQGWVQDMRPFLVARIVERSQSTDLGVLHAAAALRDPATYADLIWHYENDQINGLFLYDDLKSLPGIQLKDAVLRRWTASKSWTGFQAEYRSMPALAAIDYGVPEALEFIATILDSQTINDEYRAQLRKVIRERTGLRGSDDEIRAWFKANKDKLVFDETRRMFVVKP